MADEISSCGDEGPVAFYGRKDELQALLSAWEAARKGKPQWVSILAETGVGKTRLVQEFYRCISSSFDPNGYWPANLPIEHDQLGLNPDPADFPAVGADKAVQLPWLWWGIRGDGRKERNPNEGLCAARMSLESLELHTTKMLLEEKTKDFLVDGGKKVLNIVTVGAFAAMLDLAELVGKGVSALNLSTPDAQTPWAMGERKKLELKSLLVNLITYFLAREIPVVLVLDDAHWLDPDTLGFIDGLIGKLPTRDTSSKLLIVSTSWKQEWNKRAAFRNSYENFSGEKPPAIELGVIDEGSARAYLKEHLPGIEESDIRLILDRAQGNFRYLTELQLLLRSDCRSNFIEKDWQKPLTETGRQLLFNKELRIEECIRLRFLGFPEDVQLALERSSYQGQRFDPSLTAQVIGDLDGDQISNGETTLGAIKHGEDPGAMITTVNENLKEFLQGPYWKLIHKRLVNLEGAKVKEAYHRILMKAVEDPKMANNKVIASIAQQTLADGVEQSEAVRLYGWLIKYAWQGREAHSMARHIRAVLELDLDSGEIPLDVALVALRFRSQVGYGIQLLYPSWIRPATPDGRSVEKHFQKAFVLPLEGHIRDFQETGALPDGGKLEDLIDWCDALVEYRKSLGHNTHYPTWLEAKIVLVKKQLKVLPDRIDLNAVCIIDILDLVIWRAQQADSREKWDSILQFLVTANASVASINRLDNDIAVVYAALFQGVFFLIEKRGQKFYPEDENPGDDDLQDRKMYSLCARTLADILPKHENDPEKSTVIRIVQDLNFKTLEAIFRAGCYIQELAVLKGYPLATEFSDRLLGLCGQIFNLIEKGGYAPPSLAVSMLEVQNSAAQVLYRKTGKFTTYVSSERSVAPDEARAQLQEALASVERYREMDWLPVGILKMAAISQIELLNLTGLTEKPDTDTVGRIFDQMLADAELSEDANRLEDNESVELLQWLVMTYDKWLHGRPGCDAMWNKLKETYRIAGPGFDKLVGMIRQDQATLQ